MDGIVEALKRVNLVGFLSRHYGLVFERQGAAYACYSPFTEESCPSFFVRQVGEHWLFKDFSSGTGGSIFDFVRIKEKLECFSEAKLFLRGLLPGFVQSGATSKAEGVGAPSRKARSYDVEGLYERFGREDPGVCREYLLGRKIAPGLVEELICGGIVVHNRYQGRSYCAFAVRDASGRLRSLDNHAVEGGRKFVLGEKQPFSLDWEQLRAAKAVFVTEGIIDYLSVKTLERQPVVGLALLGNQLCFEASFLESAEVLHAAVDGDRGGNSAVLDLNERYPEKDLRIYDLEGHKDPNALLMAVGGGKRRGLSPARKIELYQAFQRSENKTKLAEEWGLDRSYLYEVAGECERMLLESLSSRKPGRPPKGVPGSLDEARERLKDLESKYEAEARKREELYCRSEFLALRLKHAELDAAEARGEKKEEGHPPKKRQIKKKRSRRRSIR